VFLDQRPQDISIKELKEQIVLVSCLYTVYICIYIYIYIHIKIFIY